MATWNLWHGCHKISPGCQNCYMYFLDEKHSAGKIDSEQIYRTRQFDAPVKKDRKGNYKMKSGTSLLVNMTSDTFLEEADGWRDEMWDIIRRRPDVRFELITKRIKRVIDCLPDDWGEGYPNVMINVTCENQELLNRRIPYLLDLPARHRAFICCPMLGPIDAGKYLAAGKIHHFSAAGEFYEGDRPLDFEWIKALVTQSEKYRVNFQFGEIGNHFIKDGNHYRNLPVDIQRRQSRKSRMNRVYYQIDYGEAGKAVR